MIDGVKVMRLSMVPNYALPGQVNSNAVYKPSFYPTMLDGFPIDQEATWIIPVVRSPKKGAQLKFWDSRSESYISQIRDLVKDTGIYAAASLTSPLITLLLSPFLTHHLSSSAH